MTLKDEIKYQSYQSIFEKLRKKMLKQPIIQNYYMRIKQIPSGIGKF